MDMTIPNNTKCELVNYQPAIEGVPCRVGQAPFRADFSICYMPAEVLLEFMMFEKWLKSLQTVPVTIEELVDVVYDKLVEVLHPRGLMITCSATTSVHAPVIVTRGAYTLGGVE